MPPSPPHDPYARPLAPRWKAAFALLGTALALLVALAIGVERWTAEGGGLPRAVSALIAPYQELFLASLPGEAAAEYVVFLSDDADSATLERFFASQQQVRSARDSSLAGLLIVTLAGDRAEALEVLRAQPFVRLAVRNQGVFFCH